MSVRAKFYVIEVNARTWGSEIILQVVTRGEDNKTWASATPSGRITMNVRNELAAEQFTPGDEFYVDFNPAPKGEEG